MQIDLDLDPFGGIGFQVLSDVFTDFFWILFEEVDGGWISG